MNKGFRLHLAAVLYFLSRIMGAAFLVSIPAVFFIQGRLERPIILGGACLTVALAVGFFTAASGLTCAACGSPVLMDNGNRKHPNANRLPGFNHRARVAWDILIGSSYQCMYCLTRCRCKKSWGASPSPASRLSTYGAVPRVLEPTGAGSIFGGSSEPARQADAAATKAEATGGNNGEAGREIPPVFAAAQVFPNATTVPVSLIEAGPLESGHAHDSVPFSPAQAPPVFPAAPVLSPVFPVSASPFAQVSAADTRPANTSSLPWTLPTQPNDHAMNASSKEPAPAANPFLMASAPPPPPALSTTDPVPVVRPATVPAATSEEFPFTPAREQTDSPPPWTIPSMPAVAATAGVPPLASASTAAVTPLAVAPRLSTSPVGRPVPSSGQLLREVITVLEEGQRNLAGAFRGLIEKLESSLAAAAAVQIPTSPSLTNYAETGVPAVPLTAPVPAIQPAAPPSPPSLPDLLTTTRNALPAPVMVPSGAALARERTAFVPLPVASPPPPLASTWSAPAAPVTAPAVPFAAPPSPAANPFAPAAPGVAVVADASALRRRFAKPSDMATQQLNEVLKDVFTRPAEKANSSLTATTGKGDTAGITPVPPPPPPASAPPPEPAPTAPAPARGAAPPVSPSSPSPFGISETPLSAPTGVSSVPAPFTFLRKEGEHFAPATPADSLEPESLPWLQPIGNQAA